VGANFSMSGAVTAYAISEQPQRMPGGTRLREGRSRLLSRPHRASLRWTVWSEEVVIGPARFSRTGAPPLADRTDAARNSVLHAQCVLRCRWGPEPALDLACCRRWLVPGTSTAHHLERLEPDVFAPAGDGLTWLVDHLAERRLEVGGAAAPPSLTRDEIFERIEHARGDPGSKPCAASGYHERQSLLEHEHARGNRLTQGVKAGNPRPALPSQ